MTTPPTLFDPGLQPERTELAWRRTALSIAIGALVSLRVFPPLLPPGAEVWGFLPGATGLLASTLLWIGARRRQLRISAVLTGARPGAAPGGGMLFALMLLGLGFGGIALAIVVSALLR